MQLIILIMTLMLERSRRLDCMVWQSGTSGLELLSYHLKVLVQDIRINNNYTIVCVVGSSSQRVAQGGGGRAGAPQGGRAASRANSRAETARAAAPMSFRERESRPRCSVRELDLNLDHSQSYPIGATIISDRLHGGVYFRFRMRVP